MQALILAGGKGTRLRPYTTVLPKPLMPVGDLPILEIVTRQLRDYGAHEIIMAVAYMHHLFEARFQDGSRLGVKISYSFEDAPLGTAGPIALAFDRLDEDFLVMNGDLLTSLNYRKIFEYHRRSGAAATIGVFRRKVPIDFGIIKVDEQNSLEDYIEKPTHEYSVSMGVNVFKKDVVARFLDPGVRMDIPDLMLKIKHAGFPVKCYEEECSWLDIGRVDDYQQATEIFEARRSEFLPNEGK
jgi:NDP-sugar pyrophosphorylase family protein